MHHVSGGQWEACPCVEGVCPHRVPIILTQTELARDVSNLINAKACSWFWKIVPYVVTRRFKAPR
jgi:hypothetical protein